MIRVLKRSLFTLLALIVPLSAYAQTTVTATTLSAALTATATSLTLASATNVAAGTGLFVDREAISVVSISGTTARVIRGQDGTASTSHASAAVVYVGPTSGITGQGPFWAADPPFGSCTASAEQYSLRINVAAGRIWQCSASRWVNVIDSFVFLPATACASSVSGNSTGTNGFSSLGTAPSIPVANAQTSASGTNTHYFTCNLTLPTRTNPTKGAQVVDVEFYYGVQTTGLGTQVNTLASGTLNSVAVFRYIDYPVAAASETPTGLAEATRADAGTLVITPVVSSFNVATTTAGEFYSAKFIPATPVNVTTDRRQLLFTASLLNTATSATITNSPGLLVHYRTVQAGF